MKEMNEDDRYDAGTGRRHIKTRRERRRIKRHNVMIYVMLPVMVAALSISLFHTFIPKRHALPGNEEHMDFFPAGFFNQIEAAGARLDSLVQKFFPDSILSDEERGRVQPIHGCFDSLAPSNRKEE